MRRTFLILALFALMAGCAEVQSYGVMAVQHRRTANDLQARATMAATCDMALGAYFRELSPLERQYAGLVCGGHHPDAADPRLVPLTSPEP